MTGLPSECVYQISGIAEHKRDIGCDKSVASPAVGVAYPSGHCHYFAVIGRCHACSGKSAAFYVAFDHYGHIGHACDYAVSGKEVAAVYAVGRAIFGDKCAAFTYDLCGGGAVVGRVERVQPMS